MSAPARRKKEKKNVEINGEKPIFIFTGRILLLFCSAGSVCKIDIKLYVISFFERYLTRTSIDPIPSFKIDKFIIFSYVPCLFVVRLTFLSIVISLLYCDLSFFILYI